MAGAYAFATTEQKIANFKTDQRDGDVAGFDECRRSLASLIRAAENVRTVTPSPSGFDFQSAPASSAGRRNYSAKGADWIRRENPSPMCPAMWERGFRLTSSSRTSEKAFLNP